MAQHRAGQGKSGVGVDQINRETYLVVQLMRTRNSGLHWAQKAIAEVKTTHPEWDWTIRRSWDEWNATREGKSISQTVKEVTENE